MAKGVAAADGSNRVLTIYVYGFQLLGLLLVFPPLVGLALNYAKRKQVRGTLYASHFEWQIRTVWWMLAWGSAGAILILAAESFRQPLAGIAGASLLLVAICWFTYRLLKGYFHLLRGRPMGVGPGDGAAEE